MAFNFQRGDFCPVTFQQVALPAGQVGSIAVLNIKGHSLDLSCLLFDVTNTAAGGQTMRLAGKLDGAGTTNGSHDADLPLYLASPNITPQVSGFHSFFLSPTRAIQMPSIIEKLHYASSTEQEVQYSFDSKMNSRIGFLVYPPL